MMEIIYKIIQRVNEGELKEMMIIPFRCIRCFQDKLSTHHTAHHMNAAAGVYVPPTPDSTLTPVEEEEHDGLSRILRPNVSLAPHARFNLEDPHHGLPKPLPVIEDKSLPLSLILPSKYYFYYCG